MNGNSKLLRKPGHTKSEINRLSTKTSSDGIEKVKKPVPRLREKNLREMYSEIKILDENRDAYLAIRSQSRWVYQITTH